MLLTLLKGKLHRATVTDANIDYEGSVGISEDLMQQANILPNEAIDVWNVTNGARFSTYAIPLRPGGGEVVINGAAAHITNQGDHVIIAAFVQMEEKDAKQWQPHVVLLGDGNAVK